MIRVVKRYESRKLYDTEESRYVSLEEIGDWIRDGQEIRVVDNATDEDVTAQILMQVILEGGKRGGASLFTTDILHELIRRGERAVNTGVEQFQEGMGRLLDASLDRIGPLRRVRDEAEQLRDRLARLEQTIAEMDVEPGKGPADRPMTRGARSQGSEGKASHARKVKAARA